jgi:hypothetical protein
MSIKYPAFFRVESFPFFCKICGTLLIYNKYVWNNKKITVNYANFSLKIAYFILHLFILLVRPINQKWLLSRSIFIKFLALYSSWPLMDPSFWPNVQKTAHAAHDRPSETMARNRLEPRLLLSNRPSKVELQLRAPLWVIVLRR